MHLEARPRSWNLAARSLAAILLGGLFNHMEAASPYAATLQPQVSATNANLMGMGVPNGLPTIAWFDWGTNESFGRMTSPTNLGSGSSVVLVSSLIEDLGPGGIYSFRLVVSNSAAEIVGPAQRFTTGLRVAVWGGDGYLPPTSLSNAVGIGDGNNFALALKNDGKVIAWDSGSSLVNPPATWSNVVAVASSGNYAFGLKTDGTVISWPWAFTVCNEPVLYPYVPAGLTNIVAIAAGTIHGLAVRADGKVLAWGCNSYGATNVPAGLSNVVAVAAGDSHSLALKCDGSVVGWGGNQFGTEIVPSVATNVVAIAANGRYGAALRQDGTVLSWGIVSSVHTNLPSDTSILAISAGTCIGLALTDEGTVLGWRNFGCGSGNTNIPVGLTNAVSIFGGFVRSMAIAPNVPPLAIAQVITGYVNHDVTIGLQGTDPNGDPLTFKIASLPSAGLLYQFNNGARASAILSGNTPVTDASGRVIFAPGEDELGSLYTSFIYGANDGERDSPEATVTINLILPAPPKITNVSVNSGVSFQLSLSGASNATYSVWTSTNLANWQRAGNATETSAGVFNFTDFSVDNSPQRFYRATAP